MTGTQTTAQAYTAGPWETLAEDDQPPIVQQSDEAAPMCLGEPDPRFIATVGCESPSTGWDNEDYANARLIASAPELLAALRGVSVLTRLRGESPGATAAWAAAAAAIRKATGE